MKGYLDVKELESYKKADIQKLARDLGVSDAGTIKEIAARCAAVEVDIPGEGELTEEEKATAAEQTAGQIVKETEDTAGEPQTGQETAEEGKDAAEQTAGAEKQAAGLVKIKVTTRFLDKQLNQIKDAGEVYSVSGERAAELAAAGVAEIVG